MEIRYYEEKPDIETYYELRTSVGWDNFCIEQAQKAKYSAYRCQGKRGVLYKAGIWRTS